MVEPIGRRAAAERRCPVNASDTLLFNGSIQIPSDVDDNRPPQYRAVESANRAAMLGWHSAKRKAYRGALWSWLFIAALVAAFLFILLNQKSTHTPGAIIDSQVAPGAPLTAENAPVRWRKQDFPPQVKRKQTPSSGRVPPSTTVTRRGASQPAPGSVSRKGAAK